MVAIVIHAFLLDQFEPRHVVRDLTFRIIIPMDKKLEALGLRAVLRQAHVHLPRAITDAIGGPEIVYKPSTPLWPYLVDSRGLADKCTRAWLATRGACRCSRFERGVIPTKGCSECHLLTTDSTVLKSRPLDAMFALGAKARLQRGEAIFEDLLDYLSDRLEEYCREAAERANINIKELLDFKTAAVKAIINHVISRAQIKILYE